MSPSSKIRSTHRFDLLRSGRESPVSTTVTVHSPNGSLNPIDREFVRRPVTLLFLSPRTRRSVPDKKTCTIRVPFLSPTDVPRVRDSARFVV